MHVYWSSVFILPLSTTKEIELLLRGFFWCQGSMKHGKAKVAWDQVCLPKREGGLGFRSLEDWNTTSLATHVWNLLTRKESLWVKWVHEYRLNSCSFWEVRLRVDASWSWCKMLQMRDFLGPFIKSRLADGIRLYLWSDNWCNVSSLSLIVTSRYEHPHSVVADVIENAQWKWPQYLIMKYQELALSQCPLLMPNSCDELWWFEKDGNEVIF